MSTKDSYQEELIDKILLRQEKIINERKNNTTHIDKNVVPIFKKDKGKTDIIRKIMKHMKEPLPGLIMVPNFDDVNSIK